METNEQQLQTPPLANFDAKRGGFGFEAPNEGETNSWLTPPELVQRLGHFDLDPCGCPNQPFLHADETYFPPEQDGLSLPWNGRVYCNPPYGKNVGDWVDRMAEHRNGILLIFSRVETESWSKVWSTGDAFLFPFGRIYFRRPNGERAKSGTAPSALVAYGAENVKALSSCEIAGAFLERASIQGGIKATKL